MFLGLIPHPLAPPHLTAPLGDRLFTDRKGNVMFLQVFVCSQSASWLLVHCLFLLLYGQYVSYWNAFFFKHIFWTSVMQKFKFDDQPRKVEFNSFVMYWERKDLLHSVYSKKSMRLKWDPSIHNMDNNDITMISKCHGFFFSKINLEDTSPFCGATDATLFDFWWRLSWVSKPDWIPHFHASLPVCNGLVWFTSSVIPANFLIASIVT